MSERRVEPEWLDELPAGDARAIRSRRDLKRVNALMANPGIVAGALRAALPGGVVHIAEIGAGDGGFAERLARSLPRPSTGATFTLLDRQAIMAQPAREALAGRGWNARLVEADVFDWLRDDELPRFDAIVANLFLHHFPPARLAELLALVARRTRCFIACEPRRSEFALLGSRLLGLAGCNDVTRHDAVVSVRAGFRDRELASLWPHRGWRLGEGPRGLFSHCFVACQP
ncbi:MAG: class I SAM-dependent methyltransferase [Usitatibacter sp.]